MGILAEIRNFVGKFLKNPIKSMAVAYLMYRILAKNVKENYMEENIRVLQREGKFEIIFDTTTNSYAVIDGRDIHAMAIPAKSLSDARKIIQSLQKTKTSDVKHAEISVSEKVEDKMKIKERITKIYESLVKKEELDMKQLDNSAMKMYKKKFADLDERAQQTIIKLVTGLPSKECSECELNKEQEAIVLGEPFGTYHDFADCVAKNSDKGNPQAYCASVHKKITGKWPSEKQSLSVGERIDLLKEVFKDYIDCPNCHGTGQIKGKDCPNCDGEGVVEVNHKR